MPTVEEYGKILARLPQDPGTYDLTRIIPFLDYKNSSRPSFLYTSGRPNRCNPRGVTCIYLSEDKETAWSEYEAHDKDPTQPTLTYHGRLEAARILDLEDPDLRKQLEIPPEDFKDSFHLRELQLQRLGEVLAKQTRVVAIRYPSRARNAKQETGFNLAIFPDAIAAPDSLVIYGQEKEIIERWPQP